MPDVGQLDELDVGKKPGELRAELGGGNHGPAAHTVLRDWLRA